ncbi:MAG: pilus assembly protein PilP [Mariprofundaceae bacterium]|nr:pilus assembly protein PilP [Mariprofundaceae bacterium]
MFHKVISPAFTIAIFVSFTTSALAVETPKLGADTIPDAMQHRVQAPDINFETLRDPFASYLATVALRGRLLLVEKQSKLANRMRQPLEAFDLSTLTLTGIFSMGEKRVAMVQDNQGQGYTVTRGDYIGKNSGVIEKIDFDTIYLVEQIVNPAGDIIDHQVTLTLKEINQ